MCFSSGPSKAAQAQQAAANQRDQDIQNASNQINSIFDNPARRKQVQDYQNAVQQEQMTGLNTTFGDNARNLKFAMARSGLSSGSEDVDLHDRLNQDYAKGVLQATSAAKTAASNLTAADEAARSRLLAQAASGVGLTDANTEAGNALASNLQAAQGAIAPATFDQFFGGLSNVYNQSQINASRAAAERAGLGTLFNTYAGINTMPGY